MTRPKPVSVGQLLAMDADTRAATIRALSPIARRKLAHLAALGGETAATKADAYLATGNHPWCLLHIGRAREYARVGAALTTEEP